MDGKGRSIDNVLIERFRRTIKYENIFHKCHETMREATEGIREYIDVHHQKRLHSWLDYKTPDMAYEGKIPVKRITISQKCLKEAA